jgi:aminoglycoside 3-N-acetyltransferase
MDESRVIAATDIPVTVDSIVEDLRRIGVRPGMTLLVHSSLSSMGWVCGHAMAVILALEQALGTSGTLVMPTHTTHLSDPEEWCHPAVPSAWWETIRRTMPAFDPDLSTTLGMGTIPETFRQQKGVRRSFHPHVSFAALGANSACITENHSLRYGLGEQSPLARLYDLKASILLIGVGHASNTSFHLAEHRAEYPGKCVKRRGAPLLLDNNRQWVQFDDDSLDETDFAKIGESLERETSFVRTGRIGKATARLMLLAACVDFAVRWMEAHRGGSGGTP